MRSRVSRLSIVVSPMALAVAAANPAVVQARPAASAPAVQDFAIAAAPLAQALQAYSAATGVQLVYSSALVEGVRSPGVSGRMTRAEALSRLLAGTSLVGILSGNTATISGGIADDGERVTGAVRVEGSQGSPYFGGAGVAAGVNGTNGSRDITATEGTGSFTSGALTIGSKAPEAIKDVPQSISVLTSERMLEQRITDYAQALAQLPGITVAQGGAGGSNLENSFYSRGFEITSFQIDGGAPLTTSATGFFPQIDLSVYDHVELLRGAATFNAYGDPGGTVNLVRKKPLDHAQFTLDAQAGSWANYHVTADATGPLAFDGALRGRLVATYENRHYFYNTAKDKRYVIYGIAEFDASPTTLLTAGIQYTKQNSVPWLDGLPRYLNGNSLDLPTSTSFVFPWNRWDFATTEIFGGVQQKLGGEWVAKLNVTWDRQSSTQKAGFNFGAVNPTNGAGPGLYGQYDHYASKQLSIEGTVTGAFKVFGQRQEVTVGLNRSVSDNSKQITYGDLVNGSQDNPYQPYPGGPTYYYGSPNGPRPPINVFAFNPNDPLYSEPPNSLPVTYYPVSKSSQTVAYLNLRLTALDRVHLTTGVRWSRYSSNVDSQSLCAGPDTAYACGGLKNGDVYYEYDDRYGSSNISFPPPVSLSVDLTRSLTTYVGYTDIYVNQAYLLTTNGSPLPPLTGSNWEAGVKWAPKGGRLNLSLAAYSIRQKGFSQLVDPDNYMDLGGGRSCCYIADPNAAYLSKGIDAEVTGEVKRGWQISASYTYSDNHQTGDKFGVTPGQKVPLLSIQPKNLYKIWSSYDFGAAGWSGALSRLTVSGGVNGQSSAFRSGYVCVNYAGAPDPITGQQSCVSYNPPDEVNYSFVVPAYAVVSGRLNYRLTKAFSLALYLENIFNKKYYQTTGTDITQGNWYGTPRSATVTLSGKW